MLISRTCAMRGRLPRFWAGFPGSKRFRRALEKGVFVEGLRVFFKAAAFGAAARPGPL